MPQHNSYFLCNIFNKHVLEKLANSITSLERQLGRQAADSDLTKTLKALAEVKTTLTAVDTEKDIACRKILNVGYLTKKTRVSLYPKIVEILAENGNIGREALLGIENFFNRKSKIYSATPYIQVLLLQDHLSQKIHHTMRTAKSAFLLISNFIAEHPNTPNLNNSLIRGIEEFYLQLIILQKIPAYTIHPKVKILATQEQVIFPKLQKQISELLKYRHVQKEPWVIELLELSCFPSGTDEEKQRKSAEIINAIEKSWNSYQEQAKKTSTAETDKIFRSLETVLGQTQQVIAQSILPEQPGESDPFFEHSTLIPSKQHLSQKAYTLFEFIGIDGEKKMSQVKKAKRKLGHKLRADLQKERDACAEEYDIEIALLEKKKNQILQNLEDKITQLQIIQEKSQEAMPAQATALLANVRKKRFLEKKAAEIAEEHAPEKEKIIETMTAEIELKTQQKNEDLALYEQLSKIPQQIEDYAMCKYHASNPEFSLKQAISKLAQKIQATSIFSSDAMTIVAQHAQEEWKAMREAISKYNHKHWLAKQKASKNLVRPRRKAPWTPPAITELTTLTTTESFIKRYISIIHNTLIIFTKHHNYDTELPEEALDAISSNLDQFKTIVQACPRADIDICIQAIYNLRQLDSLQYTELVKQFRLALINRTSLSLYERKEQYSGSSGLSRFGSAQEESDDEAIELQADIEEMTNIVKEVHSASQYKMNLLTTKKELEKTLTDCLSSLSESALQTTLYNRPTSAMLLTLAEQIEESSIPLQTEQLDDFQEILKSLRESPVLRELGNKSRPLTLYTSREHHEDFLEELAYFVNGATIGVPPETNSKIRSISRKLNFKTTSSSHQVSLSEIKNDVDGNITAADLSTLDPYPSIDSLIATHSIQMEAFKKLKIKIMEESPEIFSQINRAYPRVSEKLILAEYQQQQLIEHLHVLLNSSPRKTQNCLASMMQLELLQTMHQALIQEAEIAYNGGNIDEFFIRELSSLLNTATDAITPNQDLNPVLSFTPDYPDLLWQTFYEKQNSITTVDQHIPFITQRKLKETQQAFSINWVDWVLNKLDHHLTDIADTASQIEQSFQEEKLNDSEKDQLFEFQRAVSDFINTGSKESFYRINARELLYEIDAGASIERKAIIAEFIAQNHSKWITDILTIEEFLDNEKHIYNQLQKLFKRVNILCSPSLPRNKRIHLSTVRNRENTLEIHIVEPIALMVPREEESLTIDLSQAAHQEDFIQQIKGLNPEAHIHFANSHSPNISIDFINEILKNLPEQAVLHLGDSMPAELILQIADETFNAFKDTHPSYRATTPQLYLFLDSMTPKDSDAAYSLYLEVCTRKSDTCQIVFKDSVYTPILQHGSTKKTIEVFQNTIQEIRELSLCTTYSDLIGYMAKSNEDIYRRIENDQLHMAIQIPKKHEQDAIRLCKALCPVSHKVLATTIVERESLEHEQYKNSGLRKLLTTITNPDLTKSRQLLLSTVHDDQLKLKIEAHQEEITSDEEHPLIIDISRAKLPEGLKLQIQALAQKSHIRFTHDGATKISYNLIAKVIRALPEQAVLHLDKEVAEEVIPIIAKAVFNIFGEAQPPHTTTNSPDIYLSLRSNETTRSLAYLAQHVEQAITSDPKKITLYHTSPPGDSQDCLFIPYQTSSEEHFAISMIPLRLLPGLKREPDRKTRSLKTKDGEKFQLFRTYPSQDQPINPFTKLPVSTLHTSILPPSSLSGNSLFRVLDVGLRGRDKETHVEDWARTMEDGINLDWHIINAKQHINSYGSKAKLDAISLIISQISIPNLPINRKFWLSKLRTLTTDLIRANLIAINGQSPVQEYPEFYIWPIVEGLPHEKIQLKTFQQLKEAFELYAGKRKGCQQSHVSYASHLLSGWGCTARPADALSELSRATGISVDEVGNKAKALIYHALFFEEVEFNPSTKMLALNPLAEYAESDKETHVLQEKLREASSRLRDQQVNLAYSDTDLEKIYDNGNGDLYAGILLSQIYLSGKFEQFDKTPIKDSEENREAGIRILQQILEKSPENKMANLLYGVCLKKGIGIQPSHLKARQHLSQIPFELPADLTSMLSTDLLSWNLGALSYKMITNSKIKLDRLSFAEEVAQSIIQHKKPLSLNHRALFEPDYTPEELYAFLQIGILFNIPGVSKICLKNSDLINRLTHALETHHQNMLDYEEPFSILIKHSVFKEAFRKGFFHTSKLETENQLLNKPG